MALDYPQAGFLQLAVAWEFGAVKRPVGMGMQFVPTLVLAVGGQEEGARVRDVDHNGHIARAATSHIGSKRGSSTLIRAPAFTRSRAYSPRYLRTFSPLAPA